MTIIKKLIIRNKLKRELRLVEQQLIDDGYYKMDLRLRPWVYDPDVYAIKLDELKAKYKPLVDKKEQLTTQISSLTGKNLFKTSVDEFIK